MKDHFHRQDGTIIGAAKEEDCPSIGAEVTVGPHRGTVVKNDPYGPQQRDPMVNLPYDPYYETTRNDVVITPLQRE